MVKTNLFLSKLNVILSVVEKYNLYSCRPIDEKVPTTICHFERSREILSDCLIKMSDNLSTLDISTLLRSAQYDGADNVIHKIASNALVRFKQVALSVVKKSQIKKDGDFSPSLHNCDILVVVLV